VSEPEFKDGGKYLCYTVRGTDRNGTFEV